ncbi:hypothetical protein MHEC_16520 [Mycobacterium heckeshornense]|uniref:Uncharacterized protein n=1 Tax=Mycobacterium heckeshornense TaxID=110505 RepID=A0A7R7GTK9_9MYCO|nr:hypothetical protein MHEC_16520 [Mycobacterium heckeshornense]
MSHSRTEIPHHAAGSATASTVAAAQTIAERQLAVPIRFKASTNLVNERDRLFLVE